MAAEGAAGAAGVKDRMRESIGFCPSEPVGWLYAARGFYKRRDFHACVEAVSYALRSEKTMREAQHLLAFSLLQTGQVHAAAAFLKSIALGNDTDWQPLVELFLDHPELGSS